MCKSFILALTKAYMSHSVLPAYIRAFPSAKSQDDFTAFIHLSRMELRERQCLATKPRRLAAPAHWLSPIASSENNYVVDACLWIAGLPVPSLSNEQAAKQVTNGWSSSCCGASNVALPCR